MNALWPATMMATAASSLIGVESKGCRTTEIMADAAYIIVTRDSRSTTGRFFLDDEVLRAQGVHDFERYAVTPGKPLMKDLFVV